jgi:hypothetical protein
MKYLGKQLQEVKEPSPPRTVPRYKPSSFFPHIECTILKGTCTNAQTNSFLSALSHQPRCIATKFRTDCAIAPHAVRYPGAENRNKEANAAPKFAQVYINIYVGKMQKLHASSPPPKPKQCHSGSLQLLGFTSNTASLSSWHESYRSQTQQ